MGTIIKGRILLEHMNIGTKSEGVYAFLETWQGERYRLYRPDAYPVDDPYFPPFADTCVSVLGDVEDGNYIAVQSISFEIAEEPEKE